MPKRNLPFDETSVLNRLFSKLPAKEDRFSHDSEVITLHSLVEEDFFSK